MTGAILVEAGLARASGVDGWPAVHVVPRPERRGRAARLDAEAVLATLERHGTALVLARPEAADPAAACLPALARLLERRVLILPGEPGPAAWVLARAAGWAGLGLDHLDRAVAVCCGLAGAVVADVRPAALGRWASRAWRSCSWCGGGGLAGRRCAGCGALVPEPVPAVARAAVITLAGRRRAA